MCIYVHVQFLIIIVDISMVKLHGTFVPTEAYRYMGETKKEALHALWLWTGPKIGVRRGERTEASY